MTKTTERERQKQAAGNTGKIYTYLCDDGEEFQAYACSESGAFRVLNAERPYMRAQLLRATDLYGRVEWFGMTKHIAGYRVVTTTSKRGVTGCTEPLGLYEALEEAETLRDTNPAWLRVFVERVFTDGSCELYA